MCELAGAHRLRATVRRGRSTLLRLIGLICLVSCLAPLCRANVDWDAAEILQSLKQGGGLQRPSDAQEAGGPASGAGEAGDASMAGDSWVVAGNVAQFADLEQIFEIEVPLQVYIWTIGLAELNVTDDMLHRWLEHLDHSVDHVHPLASQHAATVSYHFDVSLVSLSPRVLPALEHILHKGAHAFDEIVLEREIDPRLVENALASLIDFTGVAQQPAFHLFVLAPTKSNVVPSAYGSYGYRVSSAAAPSLSVSVSSRKAASAGGGDVGSLSEQWAAAVMRADVLSLDEDHHPASKDELVHSAGCLVDVWQSAEHRLLFLDVAAGPFSWGLTIGGEGVRSPGTVPRVEHLYPMNADRQHGEEPSGGHAAPASAEDLEAEAEIIEEFLARNCRGGGRRKRNKACRQMAKKLRKLQSGLKKSMKSSLFGHGHDEGHGVSISQDRFLTHTSALLSQALRHVVAPSASSVAETPDAVSAWLDGPWFAADTLTGASTIVELLVLTEGPVGQLGYDPLPPHDLELLQTAVAQLVAPMEIEWVVERRSMFEEREIQRVVSYSQLTDLVPEFSETHYELRERTYIDSEEFQRQWRAAELSDLLSARSSSNSARKGSAKAAARRKKTARVVLYATKQDNAERALLVDKFHQSVAIGSLGLVLATANFVPRFDSTIACGGYVRFWDLRNPLQSVAASLATLLTGVEPFHMAYSSAARRPQMHWVWSVGQNAMSHTTGQVSGQRIGQGRPELSQSGDSIRFARTHLDAARRNRVAHELDRATSAYNTAVLDLQNHRTTSDNTAVSEEQLPRLKKHDAAVRASLLGLAEEVANLAAPASSSGSASAEAATGVDVDLGQARAASRDFEETAKETLKRLAVIRCASPDHGPKAGQITEQNWVRSVARIVVPSRGVIASGVAVALLIVAIRYVAKLIYYDEQSAKLV